jgi:hypothetical protein
MTGAAVNSWVQLDFGANVTVTKVNNLCNKSVTKVNFAIYSIYTGNNAVSKGRYACHIIVTKVNSATSITLLLLMLTMLCKTPLLRLIIYVTWLLLMLTLLFNNAVFL